jgi:hypothetical protein
VSSYSTHGPTRLFSIKYLAAFLIARADPRIGNYLIRIGLRTQDMGPERGSY